MVQDIKGLDFIPACNWLSRQYNLPYLKTKDMTDEERAAYQSKLKEQKTIFDILTKAARYYHESLMNDKEMINHLTNHYGLNKETIASYVLGYSTGSGLFKHLQKLGYSMDDTVKTGLFVEVGGKWKEFFNNRLVFPYWESGQVVYFIGRKTDWTPDKPWEQSKYKKLPTHTDKRTYILEYVTNSHFYGEDSIRGAETVYVAEGVTDCLAMLQAGYPIISPATVKFREQDQDHLNKVTRRATTIYLVPDNETNEAGIKGALDTAIKLEDAGKPVYIIDLPLPEGQEKIDVTDFFRDHGKEDFEGLIKAAKTPMQIKIDQIAVGGIDLIRLSDRLKPIEKKLAGMTEIKRAAYIQYMTETLNLPGDFIGGICCEVNTLHEPEGIRLTNKPKDQVPWKNPVSLKETTAPELKSDLLPGILGEITRAVSIATETPIELAAGLILPVLGTACQGKFTVQVKPGYAEPVNIWVIVALDPANRKSSVLVEMTKPLSKWEKQSRKKLEPIIKEAKSKWQNQQARLKSLRGKYGKAKPDELKGIEAEILEIENDLVEVPNQPQVWSQDVTTERLGSLMAEHDEKMSILSAEGGIFDIIGGRYSNGIANLDLYLQSHSSDPVKVDRGSREPVYLERPALSLGLSPQPEVLRGLADKSGFRGKGLLARFLYLLPRTNLGHRQLESEPVPADIKKGYCELVYSLLDIEQAENERREKIPYILRPSREAYHEWLEFARVVEKALREGERFEYVTDWAGKLPGAAARIAGLLHCAENPYQPWAERISLETMDRALELASIFSSHALIAFDMMGADKALEQARKIWRWIERGRQESFSKRDCFNADILAYWG